MRFIRKVAIICLISILAISCTQNSVLPPWLLPGWDVQNPGGSDKPVEDYADEKEAYGVTTKLVSQLSQNMRVIINALGLYSNGNVVGLTDYVEIIDSSQELISATSRAVGDSLRFTINAELTNYSFGEEVNGAKEYTASGPISIVLVGSVTSENAAFGNVNFSKASIITNEGFSITDQNGTKDYQLNISGLDTSISTSCYYVNPSSPLYGKVYDIYQNVDLKIIADTTIECSIEGVPLDMEGYIDEVVNADAPETDEDGRILISTTDDFIAMVEGKTGESYVLTQDIAIPASTVFQELRANLDGDGNTIEFTGAVDESVENNDFVFELITNGTISNTIFDFGETGKKTIAKTTLGTVVFDTVTTRGTVLAEDNNTAPFVHYIGYNEDLITVPAPGLGNGTKLTLRNCINEVDITDTTFTHWGISPFISGTMANNNPTGSNIILENCINKGTVIGGQVGWVIGNSSQVEELGSLTVSGCSNEEGGSVTGLISAGNVTMDANNNYEEFDITITEDLATLRTLNDFTASISGTTVTVSEANADNYKIVGRWTVYQGENSLTLNLLIGTIDNGTAVTIPTIAVDSKYAGASGTTTGEIITVSVNDSDTQAVYIGNELGDHTCLSGDGTSHSAVPATIYVIAYDSNNNPLGAVEAEISE